MLLKRTLAVLALLLVHFVARLPAQTTPLHADPTEWLRLQGTEVMGRIALHYGLKGAVTENVVSLIKPGG